MTSIEPSYDGRSACYTADMPTTAKAGALTVGLLLGSFSASADAGRFDDPPSRSEIEAFLAGARPAPALAIPRAVAPPAVSDLKPGDVFSGRVTKVLDADTLLVSHAGDVQIRLDAVDAPETAHPEHGKQGQPYGDEAAAFVRGLVLDKTVTVHVKEADKYGRFVGWVTLSDGRALQHELLREGWAWWNFFFNKEESLNELENGAIRAGRGLWAGKARGGEYSPEAPWVFRRRIAAGLRRILPGEEIEFKATRVSDGDTVALGTRQSVYDYIRLAGVDAPEISHGRNKPGQPYGDEAGARAAQLIEAEGMTIQVKIEDVDPYGRLVGWIRLRSRGGVWLNEVLVEEGWAWWYERYYPDLGELGRKQARARAARLGLWADPNPVPPWDFRRSQRGN